MGRTTPQRAIRARASTTTATNHITGCSDDLSGPRRFPCPISGCDKSFRRRFGLKEHVATHTGEKPFECPVNSCGRSFATSGNLSRHKRVQHPWLDVPLQCLVDDCTCVFPTEKKLEHHMAMAHFSTTAHACGVVGCGRAFSTTGNLRRHMRQNHSDQVKITTATSMRSTSPTKSVGCVRSPTAVDAQFSMGEDPHAYGNVGSSSDPDADLLNLLSCLFE